MRFKLTIEYAGTRYSGWQIQRNARTVQGEIDRAIREVTQVKQFELYGSGRTDAGVHALAQVAHLDIDTSLPAETLRRRVNDVLPSDINILRIDKVRHRFHARHDAVARSYIYQIARRRTAFAKAFVWWVKDDLDADAMRLTAARFVGMHDFRTFSDDDPDHKSTQVLIESFDVHEDGDLLVVHIEASHFLWKMVRRLVGVLVEVGRGALPLDDAVALLATPSPLPARVTAPASGLFLERVYYADDPRDLPVQAASVITSIGTAR
jgi:tRNA pseudouridine38-40 synthase